MSATIRLHTQEKEQYARKTWIPIQYIVHTNLIILKLLQIRLSVR
jgi:hypothetical protein